VVFRGEVLTKKGKDGSYYTLEIGPWADLDNDREMLIYAKKRVT